MRKILLVTALVSALVLTAILPALASHVDGFIGARAQSGAAV